ncbi:restriction endonuclease subunit M [Sporohalobacter salinus]|uniref:restriction endonuclease subunit M n=1 Tax=Sporohalobacter salinus TaxID=1494606 RepID=UPI001961E68F|nr:N-6 DNA methylase [Sporohalobacter salinus]MBM7624274.1 type I restriction-modification system DNA methylase subunit [Sporohalobacter salinus]
MKSRVDKRNEYFQKARDNREIIINGGKIKYVNAKGRNEQNYGPSNPEEHVRALVYSELLYQYKYDPSDITIEETVPKVTKERADIVIRHKNSDNVYAVIETKEENAPKKEMRKAKNDQYVYALNLAAEYYIVDNNQTEKRKVFSLYKDDEKKEKWGAKERKKNIVTDLPEEYGKPKRYKYIKATSERELQTITQSKLLKLFRKCHQILWDHGAKDPAEAFDEMSKIIFIKTQDELGTNDKEAYDFQIGNHEINNRKKVAKRIRNKYKKIKNEKPSVFTEDLKADDSKIYKIVLLMQHINLVDTDPDAKGRAFEQFLDTVFKQKLGQYFTDRNLVVFIVNLIMSLYDDNNVENLKIIDPSCGSAGFLLHSLIYVREKLRLNVSNQNHRYRRERNFNDKVFGIEKNEKIARVAMMDMIIFDDGHTNIEIGDGLQDFESYDVEGIKKGTFDIVLSNPPFGSKADDDETDQPYVKDFDLGGGMDKTKQASDVLFLERNIDLLKPKHDGKDNSQPGHMAIIVPDGILNNSSFWYVRKYIQERAHILGIISLPDFAFKKTGSGSKTSILIIKKFTNDEFNRWKKDKERYILNKEKEKISLIDNLTEELQIFIDNNGLESFLQNIFDKIEDLYQEIGEIEILEEEGEILGIGGEKEKVVNKSIDDEFEDLSEIKNKIISLYDKIGKKVDIDYLDNDLEQEVIVLYESLVNLYNDFSNRFVRKGLRTWKNRGSSRKKYSQRELAEKKFNSYTKTIINFLKRLGYDILEDYQLEIRELEIEKDEITKMDVEYEAHKEVLKKWNRPVFMAEAEHIGYDATGKKTKNELFKKKSNSKLADLEAEGTILGQWNKFIKSKHTYKGV